MPRGHRFRKVTSLHLWHRYLGLSAALFVVILAATGLLLNHTEELDLASRRVDSPLVLQWYGIETPTPVSFALGTHWVSQLGRQLYLDGEPLTGGGQRLSAAVEFDGMILTALDERLLLWTPEGELVEELGPGLLPKGGLEAIGVSASGRLAVRTRSGVYASGPQLSRWTSTDPGSVHWSQPAPAPEALRQRLVHAYRGQGLPLERVLLDIHSGRIWGSLGPYIMDGAAILLLLLALSGVWLWSKRARQLRAHRRAHQRHHPRRL